jgi:hypothetical protein
MLETKDPLTLLIILSYCVGFVSGVFCLAFYLYLRRNAPKARHARLAAADGKPRHDGKERSIIALVIVSGAIVFDHFKGPLFPDVFYCLNDGGAQITRMCTGRVPPD